MSSSTSVSMSQTFFGLLIRLIFAMFLVLQVSSPLVEAGRKIIIKRKKCCCHGGYDFGGFGGFGGF